MSAQAAKTEIQIMEPSNNALTPMDMLDKAISQNANVEVLEKLMGLQERYERNQARKLFDDAVASAKAEIPPIVRNKKGHNSKMYVDFSAIARIVDPIITKHGLSYRFTTEQTDRINVTCVLSHRAGHFEKTTIAGPADTSGNKNAIQAIGSTLSYLQRYSLVQMLGLAAADDDDGAAAGAGNKITAEQVAEMKQLIVSGGANLPGFLKWAKVESIEEIPADYYESCIEAIKRASK